MDDHEPDTLRSPISDPGTAPTVRRYPMPQPQRRAIEVDGLRVWAIDEADAARIATWG